MSVCSEVKRTLVKSPPELWSELSDPESLARHLDGVGEVTITRTEPETEVEWEANGARGSVRLEPSGFGTKVTLSLSRAAVERTVAEKAEATAAEPQTVAEAEAEVLGVVEPEATVELEAILEPAPIVEPDTAAEPHRDMVVEPDVSEPRRGFFARLFKRRPKERSVYEQPGETPVAPFVEPEREQHEAADIGPTPVAVEPAAIEPEPEDRLPAEAAATDEAETTDVAADLAMLEAQMAAQDEAMLIAILDRLGAAHHRPFSRG